MGTPIYSVALFPTEPAGETLKLAKLAERSGFDGVWVGDSHIIWREMYVLLGAIAAHTRRVWIGSGVTHPFVRHLTLTASSFVTLDELAKGRMRVGIGIGASGPINIGVKRAARAELESAVRDLRKLFRGERVAFDDKQIKLMFASAHEIPIYVAASTPGSIELAAQAGDGTIGGGRKDTIAQWIQEVREAVMRAGRDPESFQVVSWIPCSVAASEKAARDAVKPHVARVGWTSFEKRMRTGLPVDEQDRKASERLRREYDFSHHMGPEHSHLVPERWVDIFAVAGSPDRVKAKIHEVLGCGVDIVSVVPYGDKENIIRQFGKKIIG